MLRNIFKLTLVMLFVTSTLCASLSCTSRNLDRKKAADLIRQSPQFSQPYGVIVRHQSEQRNLDPIDPGETKQQGEARAVKDFYNSSPYRAVLAHLGLIDAKAAYQKTTMYGEREGPSLYDLDVRLTPQGAQVWRDLHLQVDSATLPLAVREVIDVTGITGGSGGRETTASAEFTWRWVPTSAGRAMMKGAPEFERLPEDLKQLFDENSTRPISRAPLKLDGKRRGFARFELFDDGWRLSDIRPMETHPLNPID